MKYSGAVVINSETSINIPKFNTKKEAIEKLVDIADDKISYCLDDSREDRISALEKRGFCICGCGPSKLVLNECNNE